MRTLVEVVAGPLASPLPARCRVGSGADRQADPQPEAYQWEHQGADLAVKIIDRYAADHSDLLLTQPECLTALRQLLETFVRSGWDQ